MRLNKAIHSENAQEKVVSRSQLQINGGEDYCATDED